MQRIYLLSSVVEHFSEIPNYDFVNYKPFRETIQFNISRTKTSLTTLHKGNGKFERISQHRYYSNNPVGTEKIHLRD